MPVAVTFCLDHASSLRIQHLCRLLADVGITDFVDRLGYRPHLTLVRGDDLKAEPTISALHTFTAQLCSYPIRLEALSFFPGDHSVLWLAPVPDPELRAIQARLYATLAPFLTGAAHSTPDAWIPHVTLAAGLNSATAAAALARLSAEFTPFDGELDRIELVRFPPVRVEWGARTTPLPSSLP